MTKYDLATLQRLSFRRQFFLGPRFVDRFPSWQRVALDANWSVTAHPDLDVCRVGKQDKWIALMGYVLDPVHPFADNLEILTGLLDSLHACEDLLAQTARFGGRWVLVAHDANRTIAFADAAGLRRVVYGPGSEPRQTWCASQAGPLAELLVLPLDPEAVDFARPDDPQAGNHLVWLPGDRTLYADVRLLLPNHYLDLATGRPARYWPSADLPVVPLREAIAAASDTLRNLLESAGHRFDLMLALTAGWDSRLTLAAARHRAQNMFLYTTVLPHMAADSLDVAVPSRLLPRLGLKHHILDCGDSTDEAFAAVFRRNVSLAYDSHCPMAQALYDQTPSEGVCITGDVGEIAKGVYRMNRSGNGDVTAHELAVLARLPTHRFVLKAFDEWLSGARAHTCNVSLLDLFCWEQEAGRLQAKIQAECDIARESFAPMNCRSLLSTMLSVPDRYRQEPTLDLFRGIMERTWPDVLVEPINGRPQVGTEAVVRRMLEHLGILRLVPRPIKGMTKKLIRGVNARWGGH